MVINFIPTNNNKNNKNSFIFFSCLFTFSCIRLFWIFLAFDLDRHEYNLITTVGLASKKQRKRTKNNHAHNWFIIIDQNRDRESGSEVVDM